LLPGPVLFLFGWHCSSVFFAAAGDTGPSRILHFYNHIFPDLSRLFFKTTHFESFCYNPRKVARIHALES